MRIPALRTSHVRSLALTLAVVFSFAAIGAVSVAAAADASAAKKCKKGYKKVGKKCKKKSSASKGVVTAVNLYQGMMVGSELELMGDFTTKSGFTGPKSATITIVSSTGTQTITKTVKGYGRTEANYTLMLAVTGALPLQVTAKIDNKTSNTLTVAR